MSAAALLQLEQVGKVFGAEGAGTEVLRGVDLELAAGESIAVVGPSGCGKSTLLNLAGALDAPTSGRVLFDGEDLSGRREPALARFRGAELGFVFQAHHLLPQLTALENVLLPLLAAGAGGRAAAAQRGGELLERVGLGHRRDHRPAQLSGGERQRVAVVRALLRKPRLLLADEPTGSLDEAGAASLGDLLLEQAQHEGAALLLVTHSMSLAARMGRTLRLAAGRFATEAAGQRR